MSDIEKRLQNTEKALLALATVLGDVVSAEKESQINTIMSDYFDANTSLGFNATNAEFIKHVDASYVGQQS